MMILWTSIIGISVYEVVLECLLFKKAGEKPWKALIPVYGRYKAYDLFYNGSMYWVTFALGILCILAEEIFVGEAAMIGALISLVLSVIGLVIGIKYMISLARCFQKSGWFAVGLILQFPIYASILAFGAQYGGNIPSKTVEAPVGEMVAAD